MGSAADYSLEAVWARRILVELGLAHSEEEVVGSQPRERGSVSSRDTTTEIHKASNTPCKRAMGTT